MVNIKFPFGAAEVVDLTATGAQDLTITDALTLIDGATVPATDVRTINITVNDLLPIGAMLFIKSATVGTQTLTFGTGMLGATLTGVAGKTFGVIFIYDGINFIEASTPVQVD